MTSGQGKPADKGLIYFMRRADGVGPVKIGCSKWPERRLAQLQIWSPEPLEVVASVEGTFADERRLHCQFAEYRLHAEWFEAAPPVLAAVARASSIGELPPIPKTDRTLRVMARYNAGHTYQAIADEFGVTRQRIEQIVRKNGGVRVTKGLHRRAPVWSKIEEVRSLASAGCAYSEIADAIGDTKQNVYNACREQGIEVKLRKAGARRSDRITAEAFAVAADYKAGLSTYEIAAKVGRQQPEIYRFLRIAGVKPNRLAKVVYNVPFEQVVAEYRAGATVSELSVRYQRSKGTITNHLRKAGVTRSRAENEAIRIASVRAANARRYAA